MVEPPLPEQELLPTTRLPADEDIDILDVEEHELEEDVDDEDDDVEVPEFVMLACSAPKTFRPPTLLDRDECAKKF